MRTKTCLKHFETTVIGAMVLHHRIHDFADPIILSTVSGNDSWYAIRSVSQQGENIINGYKWSLTSRQTTLRMVLTSLGKIIVCSILTRKCTCNHMPGAHCDLVAPSACCEEGPGVLPRHFESGRGIYGLITAVIINGKMDAANYSAYSGPQGTTTRDPGYGWRIIQQSFSTWDSLESVLVGGVNNIE